MASPWGQQQSVIVLAVRSDDSTARSTPFQENANYRHWPQKFDALSRQLRWIFSCDEVCHLRFALANTEFSKPNLFNSIFAGSGFVIAWTPKSPTIDWQKIIFYICPRTLFCRNQITYAPTSSRSEPFMYCCPMTKAFKRMMCMSLCRGFKRLSLTARNLKSFFFSWSLVIIVKNNPTPSIHSHMKATTKGQLHHGSWGPTMKDGLFPWTHFVVHGPVF